MRHRSYVRTAHPSNRPTPTLGPPTNTPTSTPPAHQPTSPTSPPAIPLTTPTSRAPQQSRSPRSTTSECRLPLRNSTKHLRPGDPARHRPLTPPTCAARCDLTQSVLRRTATHTAAAALAGQRCSTKPRQVECATPAIRRPEFTFHNQGASNGVPEPAITAPSTRLPLVSRRICHRDRPWMHRRATAGTRGPVSLIWPLQAVTLAPLRVDTAMDTRPHAQPSRGNAAH